MVARAVRRPTKQNPASGLLAGNLWLRGPATILICSYRPEPSYDRKRCHSRKTVNNFRDLQISQRLGGHQRKHGRIGKLKTRRPPALPICPYANQCAPGSTNGRSGGRLSCTRPTKSSGRHSLGGPNRGISRLLVCHERCRAGADLSAEGADFRRLPVPSLVTQRMGGFLPAWALRQDQSTKRARC